jgi:glycosyltransferase involved in cell wall biosynthesis
VSSTSTPVDCPKDVSLQRELEAKGIIVIDKYIECIEEIYQLSDCYVFPVTFEGGCIGIPLSVLEAMACNLPVVTTKFGGLPKLFREENAFIFVKGREEFIEKVSLAKNSSNIKTRKMVKQFTWDKIAESIMEVYDEVLEEG